MKHRGVPDNHLVADFEIMGLVADVQDRTVLYVGPRSDANPIDVAARRRIEPKRTVAADRNVADQPRCRSDENS